MEIASLYVTEKLNKYLYTVISHAALLRRRVLKSHQTFKMKCFAKIFND